jgi:copper homeostasis protein
MNPPIITEVCCGSYEDAAIAEAAGADRVELNTALFLGGLTPSLGLLRLCKRRLGIKIIAMVRPRASGFLYNDDEYAVMEEDVRLLLENGADGIAFGFLLENRSVDLKRTERFVQLIGEKEAVFHRAFDMTEDPFKAMDDLISLGVRRILTSGQEVAAPEGKALIKALIARADGRIEILPGAGIRKTNVRLFITETGATQVHFSANRPRLERSISETAKIRFIGAVSPQENIVETASREEIASIIRNANAF